MYVCLCKAVTDREIADELNGGARNLHDLQERLGVATGCGSCGDCVRQMVAAHYRKAESESAKLPATDVPLPA